MTRLVVVTLDDAGLPCTPEIEQERKVAIFDLLEDNRFALPPRDGRPVPPGPYHLALAIRDRRLVMTIAAESGDPAAELHLSLGPFRQVVKDYYQICESYFDAVRSLPPSQIETIDMARRAIHNDAADLLLERFDGKVETDHPTARRLFTLICVLHIRG